MFWVILNLSFKTGIFPDLCKLAKIMPIFKKDDPMLCINYRPISLLSIYSKIFEKLIYSRMYYSLNKNNHMINNLDLGRNTRLIMLLLALLNL